MTGPKPPRLATVRLGTLQPYEAPSSTGTLDSTAVEGLDEVELVGTDLSEADLVAASVVGCAFRRCALTGIDLSRAQLAETVVEECEGALVRAPRSSWRSVEVTASRLGSVELYESSWRSVGVAGTKIDYLNARASTWRDVDLRDCRIGELDLADATVERLRLDGCTVGTLALSHARLSDVDLRGARIEAVEGIDGLAGTWITDDQLTLLAPSLADQLGICLG